jgi:hypothetical protein
VYQPERVQAGIYLLFYTLLASLPFLVGILFVYSSLGSLFLYIFCGNRSLFVGACSTLTLVQPTDNTHAVYNVPIAVCAASPEDEKVMLETCKGP